ncbi:MAG: hypothetical protein R3C14_48170 [Caldilineaceae bacterium]
MNHLSKSTLYTLFCTGFLIALLVAFFALDEQPSAAQGQKALVTTATPTATVTAPHRATPTVSSTSMTTTTVMSETAGLQVSTTFNAADFDNQTFILAPAMRPERFVDCVDNRYYPMIPGTVYHYENKTQDGLETTTVTITNQTKEVMGISATVFHDVVKLNGQLLEDTYDWYAQDKSGNVWYFGEDVTNYNENGEVQNHSGAWEAGVGGAAPGIIMLADPVAGDVYREEYLAGEATDMAGVAGLHESVSTPLSDFNNTLLTTNYNPLDNELEHKYYAPGIGTVVESVINGSERVELVSISHDASMIQENSTCGANSKDGVAFVGALPANANTDNMDAMAQISADAAEQTALDANPNATVAKRELSTVNGFLVYTITFDDGNTFVVDAGDGTLLSRNWGNHNDVMNEEQNDDRDEIDNVENSEREDQAEEDAAPAQTEDTEEND